MGVDEANFALQLVVLLPAHHGLSAFEDDVELPIGCPESSIRVAPCGWW